MYKRRNGKSMTWVSKAVQTFVLAIGLISTSSLMAGYLPFLNGGQQNQKWIVQNSWQLLGSTNFGGNTTRVFGRSTTTTGPGNPNWPNIWQFGFGTGDAPQKFNNPFFLSPLKCQMTDIFRLAAKQVDAQGRGFVELDFRFLGPLVKDLHLVVLDIDEGSGLRQERLIINAWDNIAAGASDKVDPRRWVIMGQGDASVDHGADNDSLETTEPPYWYHLNDGTPNATGMLLARKKANQNRDFTVLKMPDGVARLRVVFRASRKEASSIGSHAYIGLWRSSQACRSI